MNTTDPNNIAKLLRRFFEGETTCSEERALEEFFTSDTPLPPELEPYREMFGWYASGMDINALPFGKHEPTAAITHTTKLASNRHKATRNKRWMIWWSSAAAIVVLTIGLTWQHKIGQFTPTESPSIYAGSYIVRDGHKITGDAEILGVVQATLLEGSCLDNEIDMLIAEQQTTD
ncbi:MAG: hypothetical protein OSJ37_05040 [Muribaculaceae bacterium]|jgi:hypothetical protein|nr:hypothetical protein [Muribaculaceae bacterium]